MGPWAGSTGHGGATRPTGSRPAGILTAAVDIRTHQRIDPSLCGTPRSLSPGGATVALTTTPAMAADDHALVHGGFIFGLADYAAMLAINEPTVVLGAADLRFVAPVVVGQEAVATATVTETKGKKHVVGVEVKVGDTTVLTGTLTCFVPPRHVLQTDKD